jgi:hypothetical protein
MVVFVFALRVERQHERSYNENYTPSCPLWEVKSHLAWSVVRWVTTCEARVLFVLFCSFVGRPSVFFCSLPLLVCLATSLFLLFVCGAGWEPATARSITQSEEGHGWAKVRKEGEVKFREREGGIGCDGNARRPTTIDKNDGQAKMIPSPTVRLVPPRSVKFSQPPCTSLLRQVDVSSGEKPSEIIFLRIWHALVLKQ